MQLGNPIFLSHTSASYGASASLAALRGSLFPDSLLVRPPLLEAKQRANLEESVEEIDMPWAMIHRYEWRPRTILHWFSRYFHARKQLGVIFRKQRPVFAHSNSALLSVGAEVAASQSIPHLWHLREFGNLDYDLQWFVPRSYHRRLLRKAAAVICVSQAVAEHFGVVDWPKTHILYNGVMQRDEMGFLKTGRNPDEPFRFGCVGILADAKGFDLAIRALSKCRDTDAQLLIFGDGPGYMCNKLQQEAMRCGVSHRVRLEGFVKDRHEIYGKIDCLLVTSRSEAFGRTTAEAMALGIPVIGSKSGGTTELFINGEEGLSYDPLDGGDLSAKMNEVTRNYTQALNRAADAIEKAKRQFCTEVYTKSFALITHQALERQ